MTLPAPVPTPTPGDPAPPNPAPEPPPSPADPGNEPLGPAGKKALDEERAARKALEQKLAALAPLEKLAAALGGQPTGDGKTDLEALTERLRQHETELTQERAARFRAEVAAEKGLSQAQAKRLVGTTRDELAADADEILRLFPATASPGQSGQGRPRPDPSQGSRGGSVASGREAGLAEAQKRFGKTPTT